MNTRSMRWATRLRAQWARGDCPANKQQIAGRVLQTPVERQRPRVDLQTAIQILEAWLRGVVVGVLEIS